MGVANHQVLHVARRPVGENVIAANAQRGRIAPAGSDVAAAMLRHGQLMERVRRFFDGHAVLVCAVNQVPPFDASLMWPTEVAGVRMEHYVAWMRTAYWISATFGPALSVPAGFTKAP